MTPDPPRPDTSHSDAADGLGGGIAAAAGIVMASIALSRLLGLVRQAAINAQFGVGPEADAWFAAFRIPDTIFMLLAGGALLSAVIPVYAEVKSRGDPEALRQLLSGVATLVFLASIAFAALGALLAEPLMAAIAPGFEADTRALAVDASRWLMLSPVLLGLSAVAKAALQAERRFMPPALSPLLYNVGIIVGAVVLAQAFGLRGLVWGTLIGAALHFGVQAPGLASLVRFRFTWGFTNPDVRRVIVLMLPRLLGVAALQASLIYVNILASLQGPSAVAALNNGFLLMLLPLGVFGMALGEAALPELAGRWAGGDRELFAARVSGVARHIVFLNVPAAVGLVILAEPLVAVLFQRGAFDAHATQVAATALRFFAIGLAGHAAVEILVRGFFAMQDTRTPVVLGAASLGLHMLLSWVLAQWLGIGGIALGLSIGVLVEALLMGLVLRRRGGLHVGRAELAVIATALTAAAMMGLVIAVLRVTTWTEGPIGLDSALLLGAYLTAAVATYVSVAWLLASRELTELTTRLSRLRPGWAVRR